MTLVRFVHFFSLSFSFLRLGTCSVVLVLDLYLSTIFKYLYWYWYLELKYWYLYLYLRHGYWYWYMRLKWLVAIISIAAIVHHLDLFLLVWDKFIHKVVIRCPCRVRTCTDEDCCMSLACSSTDSYQVGDATRALSVPASSAPVERVFSQGGTILKPHRSRMSDTMLAKLIFLKCNSK